MGLSASGTGTITAQDVEDWIVETNVTRHNKHFLKEEFRKRKNHRDIVTARQFRNWRTKLPDREDTPVGLYKQLRAVYKNLVRVTPQEKKQTTAVNTDDRLSTTLPTTTLTTATTPTASAPKKRSVAPGTVTAAEKLLMAFFITPPPEGLAPTTRDLKFTKAGKSSTVLAANSSEESSSDSDDDVFIPANGTIFGAMRRAPDHKHKAALALTSTKRRAGPLAYLSLFEAEPREVNFNIGSANIWAATEDGSKQMTAGMKWQRKQSERARRQRKEMQTWGKASLCYRDVVNVVNINNPVPEGFASFAKTATGLSDVHFLWSQIVDPKHEIMDYVRKIHNTGVTAEQCIKLAKACRAKKQKSGGANMFAVQPAQTTPDLPTKSAQLLFPPVKSTANKAFVSASTQKDRGLVSYDGNPPIRMMLRVAGGPGQPCLHAI